VAAPAPPAVDRPGGSVAAGADVADALVDQADAALVPAGSAKGTTAVVAAVVELAGAAEPAVAVVDGQTTVAVVDGPTTVAVVDGPTTVAVVDGRTTVAVVDGRATFVISVVTTAEFPPEHPLTNKSTAPAAAKIRRRCARPEGRRRDEQLIDTFDHYEVEQRHGRTPSPSRPTEIHRPALPRPLRPARSFTT